MKVNRNLKNTKKKKIPIDDHLYTLQEYDLDYENNEIYLIGVREYSSGTLGEDFEPGVEHIMAGKFIKNLQTLIKKPGNEPILIHMKTCGGYWTEGMAIYDAIKSCPNPVTILSYTHARSMSSIILQAANKRVLMPHSIFMYHLGDMTYQGTTTQFLNEAEELKKTNDIMLGIYIDTLKKQGKLKKHSREKISKILMDNMRAKEDVFLDSKETVDFGFADEVFDGNWDGLLEYTDKQLEY